MTPVDIEEMDDYERVLVEEAWSLAEQPRLEYLPKGIGTGS